MNKLLFSGSIKFHVQTIGSAFYFVFTKPLYIVVALIITMFFLFFNIWFSNFGLLVSLLGSEQTNVVDKLFILGSSLEIIQTKYLIFDRFLIITLALLFGVNVAMTTFLLSRRVRLSNAAGASFFGTIAGILGIGCASCGSLVLTGILGVSTSASIIAFLPLKGAEFSAFGIILIFFSIYLISKKITSPEVCRR